MPRRMIVGMTGVTGAVFGIELLRRLRQQPEVETHLVLSPSARTTVRLETGLSAHEVTDLADATYAWNDRRAPISSGSLRVDAMVIAPCSLKTLAGICAGCAEGLIHRAADAMLKEGRRLVLVARDPLSESHLENMLALSRMGARIVPPVSAFYNQPETIGDPVSHVVVRVLDQLDIRVPSAQRGNGMPHSPL
ncbi:UbiX family flavin prenyltransferase [Streptomyces spinoverrucosus]|uniref:UbiX family flavin prenyltransferase n=1 Tax=Streptomyces spinoverrucosus TaxID=284043 RepID=UPI0018C3C3A0|nr:UbiX family flavin prenyltransferase [Streptomyces spinoverrucosus]MBG0850353.1 UbiX family flavin prenyltransferase [Streptomyces spinoverrucosus]